MHGFETLGQSAVKMFPFLLGSQTWMMVIHLIYFKKSWRNLLFLFFCLTLSSFSSHGMEAGNRITPAFLLPSMTESQMRILFQFTVLEIKPIDLPLVCGIHIATGFRLKNINPIISNWKYRQGVDETRQWGHQSSQHQLRECFFDVGKVGMWFSHLWILIRILSHAKNITPMDQMLYTHFL